MSLASTLTERVTIQQPTLSDDGYGGQVQSWTDMVTVFARVVAIYGTLREREIGGQLDASAGYRVEIRLRTDVTAAMRVIWKTHTLTIHSVHEKDDVLSMLTYEENV